MKTPIYQDVAYGPDEQQKLDVYVPPNAQAAPIIFMVHGGAWVIGDKANESVVKNKIEHWLPRGYILVSINYRMSRTDPNVGEEADDVARALAYVQDHATSWGGDPKAVVLMGHSAGAHLVALVASAPAIGASYGVKPWLGTIALDSASFDVVETMSGWHVRMYDWIFGSIRRLWVKVSPYQRLLSKPAPMLLVCSIQRRDSCPQARAFARKIIGLGGRATVLPVNLTHGDTNDTLGLPSQYTENVESFMQTLRLP
jgi:acetyl esterase/lipase